MSTEQKNRAFVDAIAKKEQEGLFNPWSSSSEIDLDPLGWQARQTRLLVHLSGVEPRLILIGEAAGYQGCRFSGIPFTSERLLLAGDIPRIAPLDARITQRPRPWSEPSATIVWGTLHALNLAEHTVLSNAVPWHPEGKKGALSNRTPTAEEQTLGLPYLAQFIDLFPTLPVAALGNTASTALTKLKVSHVRVRHPAYGGATKFREGLRDLVQGFSG